MSEGVLPSKKTRTREQMEEERRLAFVAMTRAEDGLYLTEAEGFTHKGTPRYPSRFLLDIDPECLMFSHKPDQTALEAARAASCRVRRRYRRGNRYAEASLYRALRWARYHPRHQLPREAGRGIAMRSAHCERVNTRSI